MTLILSLLLLVSVSFAQSSEDFACAEITNEALRADCFHKQATTLAQERMVALTQELEEIRRDLLDVDARVDDVALAQPEPEPESEPAVAEATPTPAGAYASTYGLAELPPVHPGQVIQPPGSQYAASVSERMMMGAQGHLQLHQLHRGFDRHRCDYKPDCMRQPVKYVVMIYKNGQNLAVMPEFGTPQQAWVDLDGDMVADRVPYFITTSDQVFVASGYGDKVTVMYASFIGNRASDGAPVFGRVIRATCTHRESGGFEKHSATMCR